MRRAISRSTIMVGGIRVWFGWIEALGLPPLSFRGALKARARNPDQGKVFPLLDSGLASVARAPE